jgi:hypothetical protein
MGVKDKSLWERIRYRYTYIGTVERGGKLYKKYEKDSRIENPRKIFNIVLILVLLVLVSSLVIFLMHVGSESILPGR